MRNSETWNPSKYVCKNGQWIGSRDPNEVLVSSRMICDIIAGYYQQFLPKHCKGSLVDLGCGKSPLYEMYKPYVTQTTCCDWPASKNPSPHIDVETNLNEPLPFINQQFDTIILSDVLEHIQAPHTLLSEMHRILNPGGKAIINVPFLYGIHENPDDYYRFTEFGLHHLICKNKFKILTCEPLGGISEVLCILTAKAINPLPLIGGFLSVFIQSAGSCIINLFRKTKPIIKKSTNYPLGYFVIIEK